MTLRIKALACALAILVLGSAGAATGTSSKRVLLLYDEDKEFPGLAILHQSLRTTLKTALKDDVDLYTESMNLSQFRGANYDALLREHYRRKYGGTKLDLIVAVMGPSLQFLLRHGEEIFPGTPIVFCGADASDLQGITLRPNITGLVVKRVFGPTLDLVLRLQPDTRNVMVVGGSSPFDRQLQAMARRDLRPYESRIPITYLTGLAMSDTLTAVSRLPPNSAVLYVSLFMDGAGRAFVPHEALSLIAQAASAPVYVFVDQYVGRGAVGGHVYSVDKHGRHAAEPRPANPARRDAGQHSSRRADYQRRHVRCAAARTLEDRPAAAAVGQHRPLPGPLDLGAVPMVHRGRRDVAGGAGGVDRRLAGAPRPASTGAARARRAPSLRDIARGAVGRAAHAADGGDRPRDRPHARAGRRGDGVRSGGPGRAARRDDRGAGDALVDARRHRRRPGDVRRGDLPVDRGPTGRRRAGPRAAPRGASGRGGPRPAQFRPGRRPIPHGRPPRRAGNGGRRPGVQQPAPRTAVARRADPATAAAGRCLRQRAGAPAGRQCRARE